MENGKGAGRSGVVPEIVKVAGEAGVDIIIGLVNQIIIKRIIQAEGGTKHYCTLF